MSNMARIVNNLVVEVLRPIEGFDITDCFHPDLLAGAIPVADEVEAGWILTPEGIVPPLPEPEPMPEVPVEETPATDPAA